MVSSENDTAPTKPISLPSLQLPPLSLYIHIPWCIKKCPYCDFNSHQAPTDQTITSSTESSLTNRIDIPEADYVKCLLTDLDSQLGLVQGRELLSIFIGGGTPSLFSAASFKHLLAEIKQRISFSDTIEITLEANPGTFEHGKFEGYREAGINRLSIGIQSFNANHLQALGRIHNGEEAYKAVTRAQQAGFDNINVDLMFGLPQQTEQQAMEDLSQALALSTTHLSWYQLTIEKNTVFYNTPPTLPADDDIWALQTTGIELLDRHGFKQYEISAYAKQEHGERTNQSKHNLNYWTFGDYLAIGAGAHGKATKNNEDTILRWQKTRAPKDYMDKHSPSSTQLLLNNYRQVEGSERAFEFMLNHLRLKQWCDKDLFEARTGVSYDRIQATNNLACERGLLEAETHNQRTRFRPTERGHDHLNTLLDMYL